MEHIKDAIALAVDAVATKLYGMTREEAWKRFICIKCKVNMNGQDLGETQLKEYYKSALCGPCFDDILDAIEEGGE